ncbi:MAG: CBU_0592 family membrane protein [Steroidobacteraceae bacterium]
MAIEYHDFAGTAGVILIVGAYFLLQVGRMRNDSLRFSVINAAGAALILWSLYFEFNLSAFLIEAFWLLISLVGVFRFFLRKGGAPVE